MQREFNIVSLGDDNQQLGDGGGGQRAESIKHYLNEPQNSSDSEYANDSQQGRGYGQVYHDIFHQYAKDGGKDEQEVEHVPRHCEVMISQA
jgi:hypothetical protein